MLIDANIPGHRDYCICDGSGARIFGVTKYDTVTEIATICIRVRDIHKKTAIPNFELLQYLDEDGNLCPVILDVRIPGSYAKDAQGRIVGMINYHALNQGV